MVGVRLLVGDGVGDEVLDVVSSAQQVQVLWAQHASSACSRFRERSRQLVAEGGSAEALLAVDAVPRRPCEVGWRAARIHVCIHEKACLRRGVKSRNAARRSERNSSL